MDVEGRSQVPLKDLPPPSWKGRDVSSFFSKGGAGGRTRRRPESLAIEQRHRELWGSKLKKHRAARGREEEARSGGRDEGRPEYLLTQETKDSEP